MRKGAIAAAEGEYIRRHHKNNTVEELASALNRWPDAIQRWIDKHITEVEENPLSIKSEEEYNLTTIRHKLKKMPEWLRMKQEFTAEEMLFIEHRFAKLSAQFKHDITASEETQIFFLLKFEVLMSRNLQDRKLSSLESERISLDIADIHQKYPDITTMPREEQQFLQFLEQQLTAINATNSARVGEFVKLEEKHQSIMKDLKGTRDQRISRIEGEGKNFISIIKSLQNEEIREAEGKQAEMMRIAAKLELNRLGEYHTYQDGSVDKPILSADTVE